MFTSLPPFVRGCIAGLMLVINTLMLCIPLFVVALLKAIIPASSFRARCTVLLNGIVSLWIAINKGIMSLCSPMVTTLTGTADLDKIDGNTSYLVTSNHLSWADIVLVQVLLNQRAPQLKFFLKKQLIWVPILGLCWWALDFPFMQRHTKKYLAKHPEKKGADLKTTQAACEKFRGNPVCIFNFVEGTRFTPAKHKQQSSPYQHLLKPKSGGIGFVIGAMGDQIKQMINITIAYQGNPPTFWQFLCGRCAAASVHIELIDIPEQFLGQDYAGDRSFRSEMQRWVNDLWTEKDAQLAQVFKQ